MTHYPISLDSPPTGICHLLNYWQHPIMKIYRHDTPPLFKIIQGLPMSRMYRKFLEISMVLALCLIYYSNKALAEPIGLIGVNLSGATFGTKNIPGKHGTNYIYPSEDYYKRYSDIGIKLIRLPFRWERIQHEIGSDLSPKELALLIRSLDLANKYGMKVILDMHNYYRYYGDLIASPQVPIHEFANTWSRLASETKEHPGLFGYGLMNEPHDTNGKWPEAALAAARAIRNVDKKNWILVAGEHWSSAQRWPTVNPRLISDPFMRDPQNRLIYEAHLYFDSDSSGTYKKNTETFDPMIGIRRIEPFVRWLKENSLKGLIGEYGVPDWSESAMTAMDNMLSYLSQNCIPSTYWAGGPWWGEYALALDVSSDKYRPQLTILKAHVTYDKCTDIGPL